MRVLLVEDHAPDALLLTELLELLGADWQVDHVTTFAQAVHNWNLELYGAMLLDLDIPDGWGLDLLGRALKLAPDSPVVVLSGLSNPEVAAQAVALGARAYVTKGFDVAGQLLTLFE